MKGLPPAWRAHQCSTRAAFRSASGARPPFCVTLRNCGKRFRLSIRVSTAIRRIAIGFVAGIEIPPTRTPREGLHNIHEAAHRAQDRRLEADPVASHETAEIGWREKAKCEGRVRQTDAAAGEVHGKASAIYVIDDKCAFIDDDPAIDAVVLKTGLLLACVLRGCGGRWQSDQRR